MFRPALFVALLAVLATAQPASAQSRSDFEKLPTTIDPTGCPVGEQSERQEWYTRNDDRRTNETGCNPGETISQCMRRQHELD